MKTILLIVLTTLFASISFGQTPVTLPETLQGTMEAMGDNLKLIGIQFANPVLKDSSVHAAANLVLLTVHAQTKVPTLVTEMDAEVQAGMITKYKSMLSQTSIVSVKLLAALQAGQNDLVPGLLTELKSLRKDGHLEFTKE